MKPFESPTVNDENYLALVVREAQRLKSLADGAIAQVSDDGFFDPLSEEGNSVALLVKHLAGNMNSRWLEFLTADGEKPDRDRDQEFELAGGDRRDDLLARWTTAWRLFLGTLRALRPEDLERTVTIRGEELSVLQAINRQLVHYAYHVGQLVFLAKHHVGDQWESLSIPKNQSRAFNANPKEYLEKAED